MAHGLLTLCGFYLLWIIWEAYFALSPQIRSRGLHREIAAPQIIQNEAGHTVLLDARVGSLAQELNDRYRWPQALIKEILNSPKPQQALITWLISQGDHPQLIAFHDQIDLPALLWDQKQEREPILLIARYAGQWVRYDAQLGVVLGDLPVDDSSSLALTSDSLNEARW